MAGIYLHIPFCKRICAYCDFYKSAQLKYIDKVVERMHEELQSRTNFLPSNKIDTIYFGGGTPSLLSVEKIESLIEHIFEIFDCSNVGEITLEANPDDLTDEYLEALARSRVNRLSIGIQSFDDRELKFMNRRHSAEQVRRCVKMAKLMGFNNLSIDLIFGVKGFGGETLLKSIDEALKLNVEHISLYHLTIEPGTAFGRRAERGELSAVDEEISEEEFSTIRSRCTEAGYEHYEISNFAREGFRARHNSSYWEGEPYLGIGPSAHSYNGKERCWSTDSVESYILGGEFSFEKEFLTERDHINERIMTGLRTARGVDLQRFRLDFGEEALRRVEQRAEKFFERNLLSVEDGFLRIKPEDFLISDSIIGELFED